MTRPTIFLITLLPFISMAQDATSTSKTLTISGEVKNEKSFSIADIKKIPSISIGTVAITNHMGEKKSEATNLKGVLLIDLLKQVELNSESPKVLSEFYFVCRALDDYKVVFSWNEIFNTTVGESVYIITEKNGKGIDEMSDAILLMSTHDFKTGRRHVKSISKIEVRRVN